MRQRSGLHYAGRAMKRTPLLLVPLLSLAVLPACDLLVSSREREREAEIAKLRAEKAQAQEEARRLEQQVKEQQAKIDALLTQLANAKDEAARAAIEKQIEAERARAGKLPRRFPKRPFARGRPRIRDDRT